MEFPRFVFTSPGTLQCQGGTYGQELVQDQVEYDAAVKAGFKPTIPEALKEKKEAASVEAPLTGQGVATSPVVKAPRSPRGSKTAKAAKNAASPPQAPTTPEV